MKGLPLGESGVELRRKEPSSGLRAGSLHGRGCQHHSTHGVSFYLSIMESVGSQGNQDIPKTLVDSQALF